MGETISLDASTGATPMTDLEKLREEIARIIWNMDQDSVERPFEKLSGPVLDDLFDAADEILSIPSISELLKD